MCAISGIFIKSNERQIDIKDFTRVENMINEQSHRGPDDEGSWSNGKNLILGHDRLSIIDLSLFGHQPMKDRSTGNVIVFNGEIYNYRNLRDELIHCGVSFSSDTDTEVLLKGYAYWGITILLKKINGIFAFVIWDNQQEIIILARDHMGVKPLYYYENNNMLIFASEVRALLKAGINAQISADGLFSYLEYGAVQEPYTIVDGIYSIPPSTYKIYKSGEQNAKVKKYWNYSLMTIDDSKKQAIDKVSVLLEESISNQMISDAPLGAFLSGGIDSSAIVSTMRRVNKDSDIRTFSVIFDNPEYDERSYARLVAKNNKTKHQELLMTGEFLKDNIRLALGDMDQPTVDGINTWFVSKLVRDTGLKVALSGVGGDELFVGYNGFLKERKIYNYGAKLKYLPNTLGYILEKNALNEKMRKVATAIFTEREYYFLSRRILSDSQIDGILRENNLEKNIWFNKSYRDTIEEANKYLDMLSKISFLEQKSYMLSTLLRDTDQMGMAHSLEIRVPLLDYRLSDYVTSLSAEAKYSNTTPKELLIKSCHEKIPNKCIYRKKQGFTFPFECIFRNELKTELEEFIFTESQIFDNNQLKKFWHDFKNGKLNWSRIWLLYVLDNWLKQWNVGL